MSGTFIGKRRLRGLLCLIITLVTVTGGLMAASPAENRVRQVLAVQDPRPIAKAIETLGNKYGYPITYEDPRYEYLDDLEDVAVRIRRNDSQYAPDKAPKVLVPKSRSISVEYAVSAGTGHPDSMGDLVRQVLNKHAAGSNGVLFDSIELDGMIHVVPVQAKDQSGRFVQQRSVLEVSITMPAQSRTALQTIEEICKTLTETAKVPIWIGVAPWGPLVHERVTEGAKDEPARDVLVRTLKATTREMGKRFGDERARELVWLLFYDATVKEYALNLRLLPRMKDARLKVQESSLKENEAPAGSAELPGVNH